MATKKADSVKKVRDSRSDKFIDKKRADRAPCTVPVKKDTGGTESTGPKKK